MANKAAKKKPAIKKTSKAKPEKRPKETKPKKTETVKVYFIDAHVRGFLLEYLQLSPAGQYAPRAVMNVTQALENAASGMIEVPLES